MEKIICLLLVFLPILVYCQPQKGIIQGKVIDMDSKESLIGANLYLKGTGFGAVVDFDGYYKFKDIPPGKYIIVCELVGYSSITDTIKLSKNHPIKTKNFKLKNIGPENFEYGDKITVKGYYSFAFEYDAIVPCDSTKPWWIEANDDFYKRYRILTIDIAKYILTDGSDYHPDEVFCVLKGNLSKKGHYGHLGGCEYQFKVKEVIKMKKMDSSDCRN